MGEGWFFEQGFRQWKPFFPQQRDFVNVFGAFKNIFTWHRFVIKRKLFSMKRPVILHSLFLVSLLSAISFIPPVKKKRTGTKRSPYPYTPGKKRIKTVRKNPYYIIVDKSDYELKVYDEGGLVLPTDRFWQKWT